MSHLCGGGGGGGGGGGDGVMQVTCVWCGIYVCMRVVYLY